jgi:hypothetical protein
MRPLHRKRLCERLSAQLTCSRSNDLSALIAKATALGQLDIEVQNCLPAELRTKLQLVEVDDDTLILNCQSAAFATRLRMLQEAVIRALQRNPRLCAVKRIEIRIRPPSTQRTPARRHLVLSQENARLLLEEAGHTGDKQLKAVLIRMAQRADPQS